MWGMAGWTGSDDEESRAVARPRRRARVQLLRHGLGLRRGRSEQLLGELLKRHPGQAALHRDQDPAEEPQVAGAAGVSARRRLPRRLHPRVHREQPAQPRRADASTCSSSTSGATPGRTTTLAARGRVAEGRRAGPRDRHQHQPLAAGERAEGARAPISSTACRSSTTSSTRRPRTSCSSSAERRNIAVIARVPFDEGSLTGTLTRRHDVAGGGLPQHLLPAREPEATRSSASRSCVRSSPPACRCRNWRCGTSCSTPRSAR